MKQFYITLVAVVFFLSTSISTFAAPSQKELDQYLQQIGMTQEQLENYLDLYDEILPNFNTIDDLISFLGEPLTEQSLQKILDSYGMTEEEVTALLVEYGELEEGQTILGNIFFVADIEEIIWFDEQPEDTEEDLEFLEEFGITMEEIDALMNYIMQVVEGNEDVADELFAILDNMLSMMDVEDIESITAEQIAQLAAYSNKIQGLLQIDIQYFIELNGKRTALSELEFWELSELKDGKLVIEIYTLSGTLLLDMFITADMLNMSIIDDTKDTVGIIKDKIENNSKPVTEKGGKLPNTSGNYAGSLLAGLALVGVGLFLRKKVKSL